MNDDRLRTIARTTLLRAGEPTTLDTLLHRHRRQVSELLLKYADSSRHDIRLTTWMRASPRGLELEVGYLATDQSMLAFDDNAAQPISEALDEQQIARAVAVCEGSPGRALALLGSEQLENARAIAKAMLSAAAQPGVIAAG